MPEESLPSGDWMAAERPSVVIGHRGASGAFPENTRASFEAAIAQGVWGIETDVRWTLDGVAVLMHDAKLGRTVAGSAAVDELEWAELSQCEAGAWKGELWRGERVCRLEEVLCDFGKQVCWNLEIKPDGLGEGSALRTQRLEALVAMLEAQALNGRVLLSSFDHALVRELRGLSGALQLAFITEGGGEPEPQAFRWEGVGAWVAHHASLRESRVKAFCEAGIAVYAYTVNEPSVRAELSRMGISGVMTDFPERLL